MKKHTRLDMFTNTESDGIHEFIIPPYPDKALHIPPAFAIMADGSILLDAQRFGRTAQDLGDRSIFVGAQVPGKTRPGALKSFMVKRRSTQVFGSDGRLYELRRSLPEVDRAEKAFLPMFYGYFATHKEASRVLRRLSTDADNLTFGLPAPKREA